MIAAFQAYLDNIQAKTGKTGADFKAMAAEKGLTKTGEILAWLKSDYGLGRGHGMAIAHLIVNEETLEASPDDKINKLFSGSKAKWLKIFHELEAVAQGFGPDVSIAANQTYVNLQRMGKKFAIIQPSSAARLDIGIKLKDVEPAGILEAAGAWNEMVTHRVTLTDAEAIEPQLPALLKRAYDNLR